jgi:hypothetical protein
MTTLAYELVQGEQRGFREVRKKRVQNADNRPLRMFARKRICRSSKNNARPNDNEQPCLEAGESGTIPPDSWAPRG